MSYTTVVKGSEVIKWVKQGDTMTTYLASTKPLVQYIKSGSNTPTPDWSVSSNQPIIYPVVRTSLMDQAVTITANSDEWSYNNAKITFGSDGVSTSPAGLFKRVTYTTGNITNPALQIIKNLGSRSNNNNDVIGFVGAADPGGYSAKTEAVIDIKIEEVVGDPYIAYIDVTDGGVIDRDTSSVRLTGRLVKGNTDVTSGVTYMWKKRSSTGTWVAAGSSSQTLVVTESMIDTQETFMCEFTISPNVVASATCKVYDETDPYVVVLQRDTVAAEISRLSPEINYTPKVIRRSDPNTNITGMTFAFALFKASGETVSFSNTPTATSCKVTYTDMQTAKGDITIEITATK